MPSDAERPVLIAGTRGARQLASLLDGHPRLGLVPPTTLLSGLIELIESNQPALVRYGYPEQYWRNIAARFLHGLQGEHAAGRGKARRIEIVPPGVPVGRLDRFFPSAHVIHVREWPSAARHLRLSRYGGTRRMSARHLEVWHRHLLDEPVRCLREVLDFIGEPTDASGPDVVIDLTSSPGSVHRG